MPIVRTLSQENPNLKVRISTKITASIHAREARLTQIKIYYNNAVLSSLSFLNLDQA